MGRLEEARERLDRIPGSLDPEQGGELRLRFGEDPGVAGASFAAWLQWLTGEPEAARATSAAALASARALEHPLSLVYALLVAAIVHQFRCEPDVVTALAEEADERAGEHGIAVFQAWGRVLRGWAAVRSGDAEGGIAQIRDGLDAADATGSAVLRPYYMALLAESHLDAGAPDEARRIVRDAAALAEANSEVFWRAELHRLDGDIALASPVPDEAGAEEAYRAAMAVARGQGATALELRAADPSAAAARAGPREEAQALPGG